MARNKSGKKSFKDAQKNGGLMNILLTNGYRTYGGNTSQGDRRVLYNSKKKNNK